MASNSRSTHRALTAAIPAAIALCGIAITGMPKASATNPQVVKLGNGALACRDYLTLDRITKFSAIPEGHPNDRVPNLVTLSLLSGECRDLRRQIVAKERDLWNYARVMTTDGNRYFVLLGSITS